MPRPKLVSGHGSPPDGLINQSCEEAASPSFFGSGRELMNEISSPDGVQRGDAWP
jgi:hypothetical protein